MEERRLSKEELRQKAIELYKNNWKISEICSTLGYSRTWFYKWLNRSHTKGRQWYKEESRRPRSTPRKTDEKIEQLVLNIRKQLMSARYSQYGPQAIHYSMLQQGYPAPPVWTIARILERHGLVRPKRGTPYISKGKRYPYQYALCHQMDFAGPRYLSSKARYYFLTLIDQDSHFSQTAVLQNKTASSICDGLIGFWKTVGTPDFLQMDNELAFWGSLKHPGAVGKVIRLCLLLGVTPVFIPQSEPWRNGVVEHFNSTMQKLLLGSEHKSIAHLRKAAAQFDEVHNETHHYSSQNGGTPQTAFELLGYPLAPLDEFFTMPEGKLPLETGEIHVIRFIRSDRKFNLFGQSFLLPEEAKYEYVRGTILTDEHRLLIFLDQKPIAEFRFMLF